MKKNSADNRKKKTKLKPDLKRPPCSTGETCAVENKELPSKITRSAVETETTTSWPQRNKYVVPERCILCEKDSSRLTKDPVCQQGFFSHNVLLKDYKVGFDSMLL